MNVLSDEELADKFKQEHSEQFQVLVRMHLSFVLDLNTNENDCTAEKIKLKKWNLVPFVRKSKLKNIEGIQLTEESISCCHQLITFLKKEQNIKVEGIFRRTGSLARQHELRNLLDRGKADLEGGTFSVHDCASVLKGFLSELSDPLLTEAHFPAYCQIAELCMSSDIVSQEEKLLEALQLLIILLPAENKALLRQLLDLLHLTTLYESSNKMSAENLAKLFTPHLLCPRKLSPEQLHSNSQNLCGIITFMIKCSSEVFKIPRKLMIECRARYDNNRLLEQRFLDESVSDQCAAKTVFTFVDHERTAKENESNPTETALAQLYAHIQSLPESSKKRKLVKQFNKENGHGTPLQVTKNTFPKNKSFGDSIKRHIFHKKLARSIKVASQPPKKSSLDDITNETMMTPRSRKPVLLVSGTNINALHEVDKQNIVAENITDLPSSISEDTSLSGYSFKKSKSDGNMVVSKNKETMFNNTEQSSSLPSTFREYLSNRSIIALDSPQDLSFSSRTDDYNSSDYKDLSDKLSDSLLRCLNGNDPEKDDEEEDYCDTDQKKLVLKPRTFDQNGQPIVFETSF